jgi:predicted phage baseplate assembly protein
VIPESPQIDGRTATEIARQLHSLQREHVPSWPQDSVQSGPGEALIQICSRYAELIISRLNRAPGKNFLAFLDLLGVSRLPLQAARVPLTFFAVPNAPGDVLVPARTQVAAELSPGETSPAVFETERELVITSARLESVLVKNPLADEFGDYSAVLSPAQTEESKREVVELFPVFRGNQPIRHVLYIGLSVPGNCAALKTLRLSFVIGQAEVPSSVPLALQWEVVIAPAPGEEFDEDYIFKIEEQGGVALTPVSDGTGNFTQNGDIVFENVVLVPPSDGKHDKIQDKNKETPVDLVAWIRCRLLTPITREKKPQTGKVGEAQLSSVTQLTATLEIAGSDEIPKAAFLGNTKLDVTKEFFPFGERPKFGDTFYLAAEESLSIPGADVTLDFVLVNPASAGPGAALPPVAPNGLRLRWEYWDGEAWSELGTSDYGKQIRRIREDTGFADGTQAISESGTLQFRLPQPARPTVVNGCKSLWIRASIVAGDYGREAYYEKEGHGYTPVAATLAPPCIRSVRFGHSMTQTSVPGAVLALNDGRIVVAEKDSSLRPFELGSDTEPALYLGFSSARAAASSERKAATFSGRPLSLYVGIVNTTKKWTTGNGSLSQVAAVSWDYWNGRAWTKAVVEDDTQGLLRRGAIRLLTPNDISVRNEFGIKRYWLRARRTNNVSSLDPYVRFICLNTVMASGSQTIESELLGSSNGEPNQTFKTLRAPVLPGQCLEISESTVPGPQERTAITLEEGSDAIVHRYNRDTRSNELWIRWHEVPNFCTSRPRDRHYVMDHMTGVITLGDGVHGLIPPRLVGNIRMASYRTGSGASGNKPAGAIKQLRSAIPYVIKVDNPEPATGGADTEAVPSMISRAPSEIRHGFRAVTPEDFEDLAKIASPEVARAKCVPLHDLSKDPDVRRPTAGIISLIVAPRSRDPKPELTVDLMGRIASFLDQHRLPAGKLILVAPDYVRVDVTAEITILNIESAASTQHNALKALQDFLHPAFGGWKNEGWEFGRKPEDSDIYSVLRKVPGTSHVRRVLLTLLGDRPGAERTGRFVIYGGQHSITVTTTQ